MGCFHHAPQLQYGIQPARCSKAPLASTCAFPPPSLSTSDLSGRSTSSACRVCWGSSYQLQTHRDYARRTALPPARPNTAPRQPSTEQELNLTVEVKANMRQLYHHCESGASTAFDSFIGADHLYRSLHHGSSAWGDHTTSDWRIEEPSAISKIIVFSREMSITLLQHCLIRSIMHRQQPGG